MRRCAEIETLVTLYVDGEANEEERRIVDAHIATCPACRASLVTHGAIRRFVRARAAMSRAMGLSPAWRPQVLGYEPRASRRFAVLPGVMLTAAAVLIAVAIGWLVVPAAVSATGLIVDSRCAELYRNGNRMPGDERDCTLRCVERGADFVFVSNGVVYSIRNQDFAELAPAAGRRVQLIGTVAGLVIQVSTITYVPQSHGG